MRYTKQHHIDTCVATAIINAFRWLGVSVPYKKHIHYFDYEIRSRNIDHNATLNNCSEVFTEALEQSGLKSSVAYMHGVTPYEIQLCLEAGFGVIMRFCHPWTLSGHAVFIEGMSKSKKTFRITNMYEDGNVISYVSKKTIHKLSCRQTGCDIIIFSKGENTLMNKIKELI